MGLSGCNTIVNHRESVVWDFKAILIADRTREKFSKNTELNSINQIHLTESYRTLYQTAEYILFSVQKPYKRRSYAKA